MNLNSILSTLVTSGQFGHAISTEESIVLQNSLVVLKNENHFRKIYFWGRIFGTEKDYYIAYGFVKDALFGQIYYYSTDCLTWGLLPSLVSESAKLLTPLCTPKFQGDPSLVIDVLIEKDDTFNGELVRENMIRKLKEEDRLAATIYLINQEAAVVPRGALFKGPDGVVVENLNFEGLSLLEVREIKSFLHFRPPTQVWNSNLLTRDDYNYAMDFLDPLDLDIPEGCWTNQLVGGDRLVILKSLYWPGMIFYHHVREPNYGSIYCGNGKRCLDAPFMLVPFL